MARSRKKAKAKEVLTVEAEIMAAVPKVKRKKKEKEQAFLLRVVKAIAQLDEEAWDELSEEAQDWYDTAAEAANESDDIPGLDEAAEEDEEDEEDEDEDEEAEDEEDEDEEDEEDEDEDEDDDDDDEEADDEEDDDGEEEDEEDEEDEDEEDGEEDDEDEDDDGKSLEVEDMEKGKHYSIETEADSFTGEFKTTTARGVVTLLVGDDKVKIREADMTWIEEAEAPEKTKPARRSRSRGGEKKTPVGQIIRELVAKFPGLSESKLASRLKKSDVDVNASTLRVVYRDAHSVIDLLKAEGWKKAKK